MISGKKKHRGKQYSHRIYLGLTASMHEELLQLMAHSEYQYKSDLIRDILGNKRIKVVYRDKSIDMVMMAFGEYLKGLQQLILQMEQITQKVMELCDLEQIDYLEQKIIKLLEDYKSTLDKAGYFINELGMLWLQK
ncbi:hypothetical protein SAMN05192529_11311 [Arachidicoccus rhizosphaerae]|jgi:hypothetical protein|uniref:Uncharacterized protein n=1 Tax=Arachidicoccus rhizosphaerae TaxID=551991 RepID=A0A1H4A1Z3_9BACT|nr:hypothetical protein [Arachidicoccus rhizosphaerae]SEA30059.1 hypothetical protein SAMN05192529_11311 [Arachidicoccus rhizosphaerae]